MALLDACARTAFPTDLRGSNPNDGGWEPGPVHIKVFEEDTLSFAHLLHRSESDLNLNWIFGMEYFFISSELILHTILSRLSLRKVQVPGRIMTNMDLEGVNLSGANLFGTTLLHANLYGADLRGARLRMTNFMRANLLEADLRDCNLDEAFFDETKLDRAKMDRPPKKNRSRGRFLPRPLELWLGR